MIEEHLRSVWRQLLTKKPFLPHFLQGIRLRGIRGIEDLRLPIQYPVTVIAGENASGKSTVLFAAACAYRVPGAGARDFFPSTLFPDYRPETGPRGDELKETLLEYGYTTPDGLYEMRWRRGQRWKRSFFGRQNAVQPERPVYLRTLANLTNPSEVRSILSRSRPKIAPSETPLVPEQLLVAEKTLPFRYQEVVDLSLGAKRLLFAVQKNGPSYSELHMAAGERAILRLALEVGELNGALVLIDEVEAGLHPWVQQLLMLQLQQLAVRNDLQILLTTHSPVVLDSVPTMGRIFLERDSHGRVTVAPLYHDVVQNVLYGRTVDALSVLCEDETAEAILEGVLDALSQRHFHLRRETIHIGRDTGASEFPTHAAAFRKFGKLDDFIFVLDGDQRATDVRDKIQRNANREVPVFYLPGSAPPEVWVWEVLRRARQEFSIELGATPEELAATMARQDAVYDVASASAGEIAKAKLFGLSDSLRRRVPEICRLVARFESRRPGGDLGALCAEIETAVREWRLRRDEWS